MTAAGDAWGYSMLAFELLTGEKPFGRSNRAQIHRAIDKGHRPAIPADVGDKLRGLIGACWAQDPEMRPPMRDVVTTITQVLDGQSAHWNPVCKFLQLFPKICAVFRTVVKPILHISCPRHRRRKCAVVRICQFVTCQRHHLASGRRLSSPHLRVTYPMALELATKFPRSRWFTRCRIHDNDHSQKPCSNHTILHQETLRTTHLRKS